MGVVQEWWRGKLKNTGHGKSRDLCIDCDSCSVYSQSTQILYAKKNVILCELGYGECIPQSSCSHVFQSYL